MEKSRQRLPVFFALLLTLHLAPVHAGEFSAILNGKSHHFDSTYDWNENNIGVGLEYEFDSRQGSAWKKIAMASGFRDSNDSMAYLAGGGLHRRLFETERMAGFHVYAGLNAFLMTRDDVNQGRPFAGVLPSLSFGNDLVGINLTYLPKKAVEQSTGSRMVDPTLSGILFMQLKLSMDLLMP